jgi:dTDP-4-dehydrorhamnose 3,5-epimerase
MHIRKTELDGLVEIIPQIYRDERGYFFEHFHQKKFEEAGLEWRFVQDNQSFSKKNVVRGLHFQRPPYEQGKLVRVVSGKILDVVVDLRRDSPHFGRHVKLVLDGRKQNMLYVPPGFAHGFLALDDTIFQYKCTNFYHGPAEMGIVWNDTELGIDWGIQTPLISDKDRALPSFSEYKMGIGIT